LKKLIKI